MRILAIIWGCLFLMSHSWSCEFQTKRPFLSLSGPVTHFLYQLDPQLWSAVKAISVYHGFEQKDFAGEILAGGLFLSEQVFKRYQHPIVFYDENQEHKRIFSKMKLRDAIPISTQGDPFQVYERTKAGLIPYLKNCDREIGKLDREVQRLRQELVEGPSLKSPVVFFLGRVDAGKRRPNLIMVRDGMVLFLINENKIETYPSPLSYLPPAQKILQEMGQRGKLLVVGLESERPEKGWPVYQLQATVAKASGEVLVNVQAPSLLIPGLGQLRIMRDLYRKLLEIEGNRGSLGKGT